MYAAIGLMVWPLHLGSPWEKTWGRRTVLDLRTAAHGRDPREKMQSIRERFLPGPGGASTSCLDVSPRVCGDPMAILIRFL